MTEKDPLEIQALGILIEAGRRFAFYDLHREHPFTKKLHAALGFFGGVESEQIKVDLFLDDSLHPTPIKEIREYNQEDL